MPRPGLVGCIQELVCHSFHKPPTGLLEAYAPQAVSYVLSVTQKSKVIFKEVLPVRCYLPAVAFACHGQLLTADMVALGVQFVITHHTSRTRQQHVGKRTEVIAYIAIHRTVTSPLSSMVKLITHIYRQPSAKTKSHKLMVQITALHIYVIHQPRMRQSAFQFEVTVAPGERYIPVYTYCHTRQWLAVTRQNHTAHT